ncbi:MULTISPECIES: 4Fe-4S binding protein [Dehalobacter]|jgi:MinD superfamily P-loop ATPase|uniref:ATPase n=2 Tax=Dehalobacter restrictus TaxID=55583 RepID=A0A857DFZ1_9FIRM|nr:MULTISPECIES: 4Fe-4S binding protein [Dehalobacter]AHF08937.1 ATPase [Dehalobacter restrictus DSM 9455]MCG1026052.1 ATP-binding protein [Dehalobacter sp.]MDJ0306670.1 ATP-binding protein [Dehalobacter sp.]OCZ50904.1 ATPase [Dehalobacter sp. TeCB1]QGZ99458.1 ATPase [Dehalobacter restrictus]
MKIAVLSGKGGTGKTLVSVNLAAVALDSVYIDCDVEEPNGHLFFQPKDLQKERVTVKLPQADPELCTGCRTCVNFCKFNALAYIKNKLIVFNEVCHSCGGCLLFCPQKAISEKEREIGLIQSGISGNVRVVSGMMNIGEVSGVPIIKKLLQDSRKENKNVFLDCPPGSACMVMESIKDADYCILVAEPTVFGVHNLEMVYELVRIFQKPFGVVLNKCLEEENPAEDFCLQNQITILEKIPFDLELGTMHSNGQIAVRKHPKYKELFLNLLKTVSKEARHETASDT